MAHFPDIDFTIRYRFEEAGPLLTDAEHETLTVSADLANRLRALIGSGPQAAHDWNEVAGHVHAIQNAVLAQAAARAYPDRYRLMGEVLP